MHDVLAINLNIGDATRGDASRPEEAVALDCFAWLKYILSALTQLVDEELRDSEAVATRDDE